MQMQVIISEIDESTNRRIDELTKPSSYLRKDGKKHQNFEIGKKKKKKKNEKKKKKKFFKNSYKKKKK